MRKWNNSSFGSVLLRLLGNGAPAGLGTELEEVGLACAPLSGPAEDARAAPSPLPGSLRRATEKAVVSMEFPTQ